MNRVLNIYLFNFIAIIFAFLIWYFLIWAYFNDKIRIYNSSLIRLRSSKNRLLKSKMRHNQLSKEVKNLKLKYNNLAKSQKFNTYHEPLIWVINLIESFNLNLKKYNSKKIISHKDYNILKSDFLISGKYIDYLSFFKSLGNYPLAIDCKKLNIKVTSDINEINDYDEERGLLCSCCLDIKFLDY